MRRCTGSSISINAPTPAATAVAWYQRIECAVTGCTAESLTGACHPTTRPTSTPNDGDAITLDLLPLGERLAVRTHLNFGALAGGHHVGFIRHELLALGEGLDRADRARAGRRPQAGLHRRRQRRERDFLFHLDHGAGGIHGDVLAVAVHAQFDLVERLAVLDFPGEPAHRRTLTDGPDRAGDARQELSLLA